MNIGILGATGNIGSILVKNLIEYPNFKGMLTLLVRNSNKLPDFKTDKKVSTRVIQGNILDENLLTEFLSDVDILVSCLGHKRDTPRLLQTHVFEKIIKIVKDKNLRLHYLISLTGSGVFVEGDKPNLIDRLLNLLVQRVDPKRFEDGESHVKLIFDSGLNYTVVRTPVHTNLFKNKDLQVIENLNTKLSFCVNRYKITEFILSLILDSDTRENFKNKSPVLYSF